jgi:hypothetical protein
MLVETNLNGTIKQKRGRKPKNKTLEPVTSISDLLNDNLETETEENTDKVEDTTVDNEKKPKKRGRKPKGGKIVQQNTNVVNDEKEKHNIILHLKCSLNDLDNSNILKTHVNSYSFSNNSLSYDLLNNNTHSSSSTSHIHNHSHVNTNDNNSNVMYINVTSNKQPPISYENTETIIDTDEIETKNNNDKVKKVIWNKLKELQHNLHINNISDKKSACFWCTYDFDNPPIYIPKQYIKNSYYVYGCFCSPECATAHLMSESIDSSSKFERYYLLNYIYSKIYDYKTNITPAPNPQYMLDKYYGNLTIQEYRSLFKTDRLFLVVDKPLTRILPELHEDNDDFIINNKSIPSNVYQVKKSYKKPTKNTILNETFGIS